jgi:hypothetical protein
VWCFLKKINKKTNQKAVIGLLLEKKEPCAKLQMLGRNIEDEKNHALYSNIDVHYSIFGSGSARMFGSALRVDAGPAPPNPPLLPPRLSLLKRQVGPQQQYSIYF